jgi:hypothetical protein
MTRLYIATNEGQRCIRVIVTAGLYSNKTRLLVMVASAVWDVVTSVMLLPPVFS